MPSAASVSEMIFMRNAIGLPFFILRADGVRTHLRRWIEDPSLGSQWVFLALNVIFDYCCKILMSNIIVCLSLLPIHHPGLSDAPRRLEEVPSTLPLFFPFKSSPRSLYRSSSSIQFFGTLQPCGLEQLPSSLEP